MNYSPALRIKTVAVNKLFWRNNKNSPPVGPEISHFLKKRAARRRLGTTKECSLKRYDPAFAGVAFLALDASRFRLR
jgi:hypothetical protein